MLEIILLPALTDNYIYLLHDTAANKTAAVDPAVAEPVLAALAERGWSLDYVYCTHHHLDHIEGNLQLKQQTGCEIVGAAADAARIPGIDREVNDGDVLMLGGVRVEVIATPGHTLGHVVYHLPEVPAIFCGDTLFSLGCGRLFEGTAQQMWQSLQRLSALPAETLVYCAHEYTLANGCFAVIVEPDNNALQQRIAQAQALRTDNLPTLPSTIGLERATNPFLRAERAGAEALARFTELRQRKDQFG